jgi:hypothetical protein
MFSSCAGLTRLRGRSPVGAAKARASIALRRSLPKKMDCRVKPGNDALRHSGTRYPNSGLPEFGVIIVQVGNSRLECADPESRRLAVLLDSGFEAIGPRFARIRWPRPGMTER